MTPWIWRRDKLPARKFERLTLRQADSHVMRWVREQTKH